jgi:hypothetical protein
MGEWNSPHRIAASPANVNRAGLTMPRAACQVAAMANPPAEPPIEETILRLAAARGAEKTICPSDAARAIAGDHPDKWGPLMAPVRRAAVRMMKEGRIVILRKGRVVDPDDFKGVYRLALPKQD